VGLVAAAAAAVAAVPALAAAPSFTGVVGPEDTIAVRVKPKKPGVWKLTVRDRSGEHNFRLRGPGVNVATTVAGTGTRTFTVRLKPGTYVFLCDPHADDMRGSFTVRRPA
jgi:hypothetical protein